MGSFVIIPDSLINAFIKLGNISNDKFCSKKEKGELVGHLGPLFGIPVVFSGRASEW